MSTQETPYTESINTEKTEINDELIVTNDPVMKTAIDTLTRFSVTNKLVLMAKGDLIPNAVAVANIVTENMLKGNSKIQDIKLDSIISEEDGQMISNIEIVLIKN